MAKRNRENEELSCEETLKQHYLAADEAIKLVYESAERMWKDSLRLEEAFVAQCDPAIWLPRIPSRT